MAPFRLTAKPDTTLGKLGNTGIPTTPTAKVDEIFTGATNRTPSQVTSAFCPSRKPKVFASTTETET